MEKYIIPVCELSIMDYGEVLCQSNFDLTDSTEIFIIDDNEQI